MSFLLPLKSFLVIMKTLKNGLITIERYIFWIGILILLSVALLQTHVAYLYIFHKIIENPELRPLSWSSNTLHALSRFGYFLFGLVWVFFAFLSEHQLQTAKTPIETRKTATKYIAVLIAILSVSYLILYL